MNDERPEVRQESRQVERDSQLSAMFDGELASAECELLARRLVRDEALRGQWSRYALIGAALRGERGVKLHDKVARRVQAALSQEPTYGDASTSDVAANSTRSNSAANASLGDRWMRFARPVVGASVAAGVAAMSILWLRTQGPDENVLASTPVTESIVLQAEPGDTPTDTLIAQAVPQPERAPVSNGEPERYSTPAPSSQTSIVPPARFANYVVAHSEYSGPLARRMALLGIVGTEAQADELAEADAAAAAAAPGTVAPETVPPNTVPTNTARGAVDNAH
jgi:negative regulator of sigma E activity